MNRKLMLLLLLGWGAAAVAMGVTDSAAAGLLTAALLAAVAVVGLGAAELASRRRAALGELDRQLSLSVLIGVALILVATVVFAAVMFFSAHDALLICLVTAVLGLVAVLAARMVTRGLLADIWAIRDALMAVGRGRTYEPVRTGGRDELAQLAEAANAMAERLAQEEAARRDLVAAVSHDLRTPLTSLRLIATALGDDILEPEERRTYLDRLSTHLTALNALIDDLFELSRLDAGEVGGSLQRVPLATLVEETVDAMRGDADAKGVLIRTEVPEELPPAQANPEKLQRVLFNLLQNAIRHTPAQGVATVLAEARGEWVELEVADSGEGILDRDRAQVFDAFYRGGERRTARGGGGGAGLGLAISRGIVEAFGGSMWLEATDGGARIRFRLPVADERVDVP